MEKKKEWKPEDLKGKTVYDFCDDEKLLEKIVGMPNPLSKEIRETVEHYQPMIQADLISSLACQLEDIPLATAALKLGDELHAEYDARKEKEEKENKGLIID